MKDFLKYLADRMDERSTWLGLVSFAMALGLLLSEVQQEAIVATGVALGGLIAAFTKD